MSSFTTTPPAARIAQGPMRRTALAAGVLYLLTFASIPTLALYGPLQTDPAGFATGAGSEIGMRWGAVLELVVGLANIGTAVVLYPVAKRQSETAALGFVASRVLESALIFVGVAAVFALIALRPGADGAAALPAATAATNGRMLASVYNAVFAVSQSLMPVFNDLLLGYVLLRARLVPRILPIVAFIGAPLLLIADLGVYFGAYPRSAPLAALSALPVGLFELTLGVWLVVRGFSPGSPVLAVAPATRRGDETA
ncbi:MAG: DUF4386 domain-containing protein [Amnibacterium sp.]